MIPDEPDPFQRCGRCNHQFRSHADVRDKRCLIWRCDCPAFQVGTKTGKVAVTDRQAEESVRPLTTSEQLTTDLHERITAAVAEKRSEVNAVLMVRHRLTPVLLSLVETVLAACDHADDVLARHVPAGVRHHGVDYCQRGDGYWPCPEVRALADLWLGKGWEES